MRRAGTTRSSPCRRRTRGWRTCRTSTTSPSSTGWRSSTSSRPTRTSSRASPSRVPSGSAAPRPSPSSSPPASARWTPGTDLAQHAPISDGGAPHGGAPPSASGGPDRSRAGCPDQAPDGSADVTTPQEQAPLDAAAPPEDPVAAEIAAGYAFPGPALELGSVVHGGRPHPPAPGGGPLGVVNRHGLIAGATGTGKTKTLQLLAEQLSAQ